MKQTVTYRMFGIPIWSVTRDVSVADRDALFKEFCDKLDIHGRDSLFLEFCDKLDVEDHLAKLRAEIPAPVDRDELFADFCRRLNDSVNRARGTAA